MIKSVQVIFGEVVAATNDAIISDIIYNLEQTTGKQTNVTGIRYKYGHEAETTTLIGEIQQSPSLRFTEYPLIWLREDIRFGSDGVFRTVIIPSIVIAYCTETNYTSEEREVQTFNPVLRPIYHELLKQIAKKSREFRIYDPRVLYQAQAAERKLWGTPEDDKARHVFNGPVDAIEILNMEIPLQEHCLTSIN